MLSALCGQVPVLRSRRDILPVNSMPRMECGRPSDRRAVNVALFISATPYNDFILKFNILRDL